MALVLEEDDEQTFEAVLSFVEEFGLGHDDHSQQQANGQTGSPKAPDGEQRASRRKRRVLSTEEKMRRRAETNERKRLLRKAGVYGDPNRARNAQARELAELRAQFEKLEIALQDLRSRSIAEQQRQDLQPSGVLVSAFQAPSLWKKLASRQRQRREEAEETNARLKLAVGDHQKLLDAMKNLLQRRATHLANEYAPLVGQRFTKHHLVQTLDVSSSVNLFRALLHQLDAAREFADGKHRYLEFFSLNVLPFKFQDTAEATWAYFRGVEKHLGYGNLYKKAAKDLDEPYTVVEDLTKELYSHTARADIRINQVIRRYVETERDAVLRTYRAEPVEIKHKLLSKAVYHLQGYAVTKRSPLSTPEREFSILQLCTLVYFDQEELEAACDPASVCALTEFLVVHTAQNTRAHCQLIENALADQCMP